MKKITTGLAAILCACAASAQLQNPKQVLFTNDVTCGISSAKTYTHAVSFGSSNLVAGITVNGVPFHRVTAAPNPPGETFTVGSYTFKGIPLQAHAGANNNNPATTPPPYFPVILTPPSQQVYKLLFDFHFNSPNNTLELGGLAQDQWYEFRLYQRCWEFNYDRTIKLTFEADGQTTAPHSFNPDATRADQYISFIYKAGQDGAMKMTYISDNSPPNQNQASMHMYAFSNELVPGPLFIVGLPAGVGQVEPPFGWYSDLAPLSNFTASATAIWTNTAENVIAVPTGWKVFKQDDVVSWLPTTNNTTQSFIYTHPQNVAGRIEWLFAVSNLFTATAVANGSVTGAGWHDTTSTVTLTAVPEDSSFEFFRWTGQVPAGIPPRVNPMVLPPGTAPLTVQAEFIPAGAAGDVRYVAPNGNNSNSGFFLWDAKQTIPAAIADLPGGAGTVILSNGQHVVYSQITINTPVTVRGLTGNPAQVTVQLPWDYGTAVRVFEINNASARLEDMTVRYGKGTEGANIRLHNGVVSNCVIAASFPNGNNQNGGGVYISNGTVTHCQIVDNVVGANDYGQDNGAGVRITGGRLEHSLVARNSFNPGFGRSAGGVYISGGAIINCTIADNTCNTYGGIYAQGGGQIINTVIAGNNATRGFSDDRKEWGADNPNRFNTCFTDTAAPINNTCSNAPAAILLANIAERDYYPAPGSPVIDASIDVSIPIGGYVQPLLDLGGNLRDQGNGIDAGCYESDPDVMAVLFTTDTTEGFAPLLVEFSTTVTGTNGTENLMYHWDFNNNGVADLVTADPVFTRLFAAGTHSVTVTVTNDAPDGASAFMTKLNLLQCAPRTLYVAVTNTVNAAPPYDSWTNAATSIQTAVNYAVNGCEIVIREGNYFTASSQATDYSAVTISKALRVRSETGNPASVVIAPSDGGYRRALRVSNARAWVSGVTLQGGAGPVEFDGNGLHIGVAGGVVSNCVIQANTATYNAVAAGVCLDSSAALLTHSVIRENVSAATDFYNRAIVLVRNGRVENCLIADNIFPSGTVPGGAVTNLTAIVEVRGSGVVRYCTLAGNSATPRGIVRSDGGGRVEYCVIAGNATNVTWNGATPPLCTGGDRVFDSTLDAVYNAYPGADCRFATPEKIFRDFALKNYRLASGSPAVNAGPRADPAEYPGVDLDNRPRVLGGKIDHGCYEANPPGTLLLVR